MCTARFGELLGRMVQLTGHDVEEILNDQAVTQRRFGEIALAWGLCQPEHVWNAWINQLSEQTMRVDLEEFGVDCQALAHVPRNVAMEFGLIPVRILGDQLVVAISDAEPAVKSADLPERLQKNVHFVLADEGQIRQAIETYYGALMASA